MSLATRLQTALARIEGATQAELARACGVTTASVSNWFTGESKSMKAESLRKAAAYLRCNRDWLATGLGSPGWTDEQHADEGAGQATRLVAHDLSHPQYKTPPTAADFVPVVGQLLRGEEGMLLLRSGPQGAAIGRVPAHSGRAGTFALQVFGDHLYPAVRHGACLVVDPQSPCVEGELIFVQTVDGAHFVCELVAQRSDAVTWAHATGGARQTVAANEVTRMHPIVDIIPGSRMLPA